MTWSSPSATTSMPSPDEWRIRVYRRGTAMALSELLPLLDHLGFVALDEQPYTFRIGAERVHLYDIGVRVPEVRARPASLS